MEKEESRAHKIIKRNFLMTKWENTLAQPGCYDFVMILDHLMPDFNVGKIFRSADFLGCREIHLVGINFFNPSPAMGGFRHVPAKFLQDFESSYKNLTEQSYDLIALDPNATDNIYDIEISKKSAFIIGHEQYGLSFNPSDYPKVKMVKIPNFGKAQSLNASVAASIAMYEWIRQNAISKDFNN